VGPETFIGSEGTGKPAARSGAADQAFKPLIDNDELERLRHISREGFKAVTIPIIYPTGSPATAGARLKKAMDDILERADRAFAAGANILILSDRGSDPIALPSLPSSRSRGFIITSSATRRGRGSR
jgi:glutamate synthase (ferredoxin)